MAPGALHVSPLPAGIDLVALQAADPQRYPLLLTSSAAALDASARQHARWDMLLAGDGQGFRLEHGRGLCDLSGKALPGGFLDHLHAMWQAERQPRSGDGRWPFRGGWALLLGYELAREVEPILALPQAESGLPAAVALRCPAALLRDHLTGETVLVAESGAEALRETMLANVRTLPGTVAGCGWSVPSDMHEDPPGRYAQGVRRVLDYLAAGDVFQVNLSRTWCARFQAPVSPAALHRRLAVRNPAPFAGTFVQPEWAVVSASPERLVSVAGEVVQTRPIAGTRPRTRQDDDAARIRELVGHAKERAEHVMLVDLERNDLGRVCVGGSVQVDELMTVESYAHVHHIVSNVRGRLRADATPADVLRAVFPGGTITGCPKVRCMQIIAELEGTGRGAYTGAMGWLNRDGDMDLNILIRSAEVEGHTVRFRTGAGIVIDSDPQREVDETRAKARGMLRALGMDDA